MEKYEITSSLKSHSWSVAVPKGRGPLKVKPLNSQTESNRVWRYIDLSLGRFHLRQLAMKNRLMTPFTHSRGGPSPNIQLRLCRVAFCCRFECLCLLRNECECECRFCSCRQQLQHFPAAIEMRRYLQMSFVPCPLCEAVIYPSSHLSSSMAIRFALWLFLFQFYTITSRLKGE